MPSTTTRRGARPSVRPSSSASAIPIACVDARRRSRGSGPSARRRCGGASRARRRPQRVDHHHRVEPVPEVEEARRLVRAVEHGRARARRRSATTGPRRRRRGTGSPGRPPRPSEALHLEAEEVRRARDARVVVADRLLAAVGELVVGKVRASRSRRRSGPPRSSSGSARSAARSSRRGSSPRRRSGSGASRSRAAPRCSRAPTPPAGRTRPRAPPGARSRDDPQRLVGRVHGLDRAHDDERNGLRHTGPSPASSAASLAASESSS